MKVVYILPISWGGIPHYTAELANKMSDLAETYVIKPKDKNTQLFSENVTVIEAFKPVVFSKNTAISAFSFRNVKSFLSFFSISRVIRDINPDIIHYPEVYAHIALAHYTRRSKLERYPIICTYHNTFPIRDLLFNNVMGSLLYGIIALTNDILKRIINANGIIVHTKLNKKILVRRGVEPYKIFIIPHGSFSIFKLNRNGKSIQIKSRDDKVVLFFGYILKNKGVQYLIEAGKLLSKLDSRIKIVIAGEGKLPKIENNNIFKIYNHYIPNEMIHDLFTQADVVVLPYIFHQGHSGVLNMAFAFGKPVIVTNVGDFPNLVTDGREGIIVPPKNPQALAEAIIRLLENNKLRKKMGRNALKKSEELSWNRIAKKHLKIYKTVINKWRKRNGDS